MGGVPSLPPGQIGLNPGEKKLFKKRGVGEMIFEGEVVDNDFSRTYTALNKIPSVSEIQS